MCVKEGVILYLMGNREPLKLQKHGELISFAPQEVLSSCRVEAKDKVRVGRPIRRLT
jgi:hypothetical protein